ncbi:hypothetical protein DPX16_10390 [Anabarilius grahami]|uniref:Uncharacterized protein n=1 Tax=Anabarilius grahami TaxID=495550 RepID=A0A3N0Y661_ANAGA|nr:hypothetical protein DPX16_10390 [Anabarilius grahami]
MRPQGGVEGERSLGGVDLMEDDALGTTNGDAAEDGDSDGADEPTRSQWSWRPRRSHGDERPRSRRKSRGQRLTLWDRGRRWSRGEGGAEGSDRSTADQGGAGETREPREAV